MHCGVRVANIFVKTAEDYEAAIRQIELNSGLLGVDTETNGLDPHTSKLWSVQVATDAHNFLFPAYWIVWAPELKQIFENKDIIKVFHNACFDYQILRAAGIKLKSAYCTMLGEKVLTCGLFAPADLEHTLKRRFGVALNKEIRKDFYDGTFEKELEQGLEPWTEARIDYALADIAYLIPLYEKQVELATNRALLDTLWLEQDLMPTTALMEYRGIRLDIEKCKAFHERMKVRAAEYKESVIEKLEPHWQSYWRPRFAKNMQLWQKWRKSYVEVQQAHKEREKFTNENGRTCSRLTQEAKEARQAVEKKRPFNQAPTEAGPINLNSYAQVLPSLAKAGIVIRDFKKATLEDNAGQNEVLDELLDYKQYEKLKQFATLTDKINSVTGRVHSEFNQIVDTGRYSSKKPNLQNIPARSDDGQEFRRLFCAEPGKKLIIADYSAIELVILAVMAHDRNMLEAINKGYDLHCYTISLMLGVPYGRIVDLKNGKLPEDSGNLLRNYFEEKFTLPELEKVEGASKWVQTLRKDYIKTMTYGTVYGLSEFGLARKFHCDAQDARAFISGFFEAYPDTKAWLDKAGNAGVSAMYSTTLLGRRRFYTEPKKPTRKSVEEVVLKEFEKDGRLIDSVPMWEWNDKVLAEWEKQDKEFKSKIGAIRRKAANHPIQGSSADITKLALAKLTESYEAAGFEDSEGVVLTVHDEIISEVSEARASEAASLTKEAMESAAREILGTKAKVEVEVKIVDVWDKG